MSNENDVSRESVVSLVSEKCNIELHETTRPRCFSLDDFT